MILSLLCASFALGQSPTLPLITNYSPKEYNAHAQTFGVVQDDRGVLYFANISGVLEFDGVSWNKHPTELNGLALSIGIDDDGTVYAGGIGEFGKLTIDSIGNQSFSSLSVNLPEEYRDFNNVWNVHVLGDRVYFNAMKYLFIYDKNTGSLTPIKAQNSIPRSFEVNEEVWYQDRESGIFRVVGKQKEILPNSEAFNAMSISGIIPYENHQFLVATRDNGLFLYTPNFADSTSVTPVNSALNEEFKVVKPYGARKLASGQIAINTLQEGIYIMSSKLELDQHISRSEGLQNETVIGLFEDRNGHLWCGTDNGISFIALNNALSYAMEGDLYNGAIQSIAAHKSSLYLSTIQGVYQYDDAKSTDRSFVRVDGIPGQCFDFLNVDNDLLVASYDVHQIDGNSSRTITKFQSRALCEVNTNDDRIAVLSGGVDGVIVLQKVDGNWTTGNTVTNFPDEVHSIMQELNDFSSNGDSLHFWISTFTKGTLLLSFDADFSGHTLRTMNDSSLGLPHGQISLFTVEGKSYFGTVDGTYSFDEAVGKFKSDPILFPKTKEFVYRIQESEDGDLWVSDGRRITHLIKNENGYMPDTIAFMSIDVGGINAVLHDNKGNFWIGGDDALINYREDLDQNNLVTPYQCLIRRVVLGEDSALFAGQFSVDGLPSTLQPEAQKPTLPYKNNSVSFEFSTTYFEHRDQIEYAHKLQGYDTDFSSWKGETKAVYTNLPEGNYVFIVKARNVFNLESNIAEYHFTILPPWYRTWWAFVLYAIAGITVFVIGIRINARRLQREKEHLEELVHQRTLELDDKNQALEQTNREILTQKALVEEKNRDITDSILYAEKIQRALLTSDAYLNQILPQHFVFYKPKSILSGDFYWAYGIKDESGEVVKVIYAAVDCTGHGVPGALMSMIGSALLNEIVIENRVFEVDEVLNQLRTQVIKAFGQTGAVGENSDGMDMTICLWDKKKNQLEFSGAKNPLWLIRNGELLEFRGDSQPVGYYPDPKPFSKQLIDVQAGDMVYTFSDGYADQFGGAKEKKFLAANFKKLLLSISDQSIDEQESSLIKAFDDWKGKLEQVDDVCVIGVRV